MIKSLQKEYFQKSQVFLYPLLNIPRGYRYTPVSTYIAWVDGIFPADRQFLCVYDLETTKDFSTFENRHLLSNPLFINFHLLEDGRGLFVFDIKGYSHDFNYLLRGRYSDLSESFKKTIMNFFTARGKSLNNEAFHYVNSYLNPEMYFSTYADLLGVDKALLEEVGELCPPMDFDLETLKTRKLIIDL